MLICYKIYVLFVVTQQFRSFTHSSFALDTYSWNVAPFSLYVRISSFLPQFTITYLRFGAHFIILISSFQIAFSVQCVSSKQTFIHTDTLFQSFLLFRIFRCRIESGSGGGNDEGNFSEEFILLEFYEIRRRRRTLEVSERILRNLFERIRNSIL